MQQTTEDSLLATEENGVLVLTMNRPHARNAMSHELAYRISDALEMLDSRADLRVAIIAGGGGTFCSGMDLKRFSQFGESPVVEGKGFAGIGERGPAKPVIAAVEGWALGGGFELALACDLIVASESAIFGLPEVKRGLNAGGGGMLRLPRRIPYHKAMELVLTGRNMPAVEAADLGLLAALTESGKALEVAMELAATIAANAPLAVISSKRVVSESIDWPLEEMFARQDEIVDPIRRSADGAEGARAFAEKRRPNWIGA